MAQNLLASETSPYLRQHKDNPVAWRPWNAAALAEAKALDRPILLSVGYAACHWCHVMARESFENPSIAATMNALFVPIKVDREERPDLDAIYQQALAMMGEQGGWPLTMFLTPEGKPFWGGTYFPPEQRWGRAGFPDILRSLDRVWREERDKIDRNAAALTQGLAELSRAKPGPEVSVEFLDRAARKLAQALDPADGGIRGAPKFPHCGVLEVIWRGYRRTGDPLLRDGVLKALDRMSEGGIYDHLGGGYARYSTDARWLAPHFEKMLYDNAQLIRLLVHAWQDTGAPLYRSRVEATIGWLLREMLAPEGGFWATIDADSEHEEGKFYVWTETEIDTVLGADSALFKRYYDVTPGGNWEGKTILNRLGLPSPPAPEIEAELARARARLLAHRAGRVRPGLDDKILADWNGLAIAALAEAGFAFDRPDWIAAAARAFATVTTLLADRADWRLAHSWCAGQTHPGTLEDHANMAEAALRLYEATGDIAYIARAQGWCAVLDRHYADPDGGFFMAADDVGDLIERPKNAHDSAVPSGNGTLVRVFAGLYALTGEDRYRVQANRLVTTFSGELERNVFALASLLNGADDLVRPLQIVAIGDPEDPAMHGMLAILRRRSLPNRTLSQFRETPDLPPDHPAHGKRGDGAATVYVCQDHRCSPALHDAAGFRAALPD